MFPPITEVACSLCLSIFLFNSKGNWKSSKWRVALTLYQLWKLILKSGSLQITRKLDGSLNIWNSSLLLHIAFFQYIHSLDKKFFNDLPYPGFHRGIENTMETKNNKPMAIKPNSLARRSIF
jgi:hypothetical protein